MITIVILTFNKIELARRCIDSCLRAGYGEGRLIVVDNGSRIPVGSQLCESHTRVECVRLDNNGGYAGGVNTGTRQAFQAGADGVFFLSNDTTIEAGAVEACAAAAERNGAGIVAPAVMAGSGRALDALGGRFDPEHLQLSHYRNWEKSEILGQFDYVPGSAFFISRTAFETLGGMDEAFFCYWEDADLGFRAHASGIKLARCPAARVRHRGRATCGSKHRYTTFYYWRNRIRFCRRHLQRETWAHARKLLGHELDKLAATWELSGDKARLAYLPEIRAELR